MIWPFTVVWRFFFSMNTACLFSVCLVPDLFLPSSGKITPMGYSALPVEELWPGDGGENAVIITEEDRAAQKKNPVVRVSILTVCHLTINSRKLDILFSSRETCMVTRVVRAFHMRHWTYGKLLHRVSSLRRF